MNPFFMARRACRYAHWITFVFLVSLASGCATVTTPSTPVEAPVSRDRQRKAQKSELMPKRKVLKRKIAIGRFSNETRYGKSFLRDKDQDPLGKQASDMLASRLVKSGKFLVFERPDINKIKKEQLITGSGNLIGVDALIMGSVTEFGRTTTGKVGFLSKTKKQTARAKIEIRLVDVRTGHVFFSASGTGVVSTESGEVAGFGSQANYDATLNDKAIGASISDFLNALITKLDARIWRTDILQIKGNKIYISGGKHQGIKVGDVLAVMQEGEKVKSRQSGFDISLPAKEVGSIRVVSLFGNNESDEGSVCEILSGSFKKGRPIGFFVTNKNVGIR